MTALYRPFTRVLVANRGEIALRIVREAQDADLTPIAVYSDADENSGHVLAANIRRRLGPAAPALSYLNQEAILRVARETGAEAVHPGYGFLAENAEFAQKVIDVGMVWIGPSPEAIAAMGDKGAAKRIAREAGVPLIPGYEGEDQSDTKLQVEADAIGWPVMIKAAMGGGGRGMRRVERVEDFFDALASARREARSAFGDDRVILEKAIDHARHVEIQVFGDADGAVVHLGERDCSVQRRNQKIIEEAPAPGMSAELRAAMGAAATHLARAVGYVNAGTVEFLLDRDGRFYFLEMNTRIQVEHPVTEEVTGLNLIRLQYDVAMGKPLPFGLDPVHIEGHAIEARLCAEDPDDGFRPQTGPVMIDWLHDEPPVRFDESGAVEVTGDYDSMIAKVVAKGATREEARARLRAALTELSTMGLRTNRRYLRDLIDDPVFSEARMDTGWLDRREPAEAKPDLELARLAALVLATGGGDGWHLKADRGGWSSTGDHRTPVLLRERANMLRIDVQHSDYTGLKISAAGRTQHGHAVVIIDWDDYVKRAHVMCMKNQLHVTLDGRDALFDDVTYAPPEAAGGADSGEVRSPMAGKIAALKIAAGAAVKKGDVVAILESMKMEHEIRARVDGTVEAVSVSEGAQVAPNALLLTIGAG